MTQEIKATLLYFIIVLLSFSIASFGVYIVNDLAGIFAFSFSLIFTPMLSLFFITKQIFFPKKIADVQ